MRRFKQASVWLAGVVLSVSTASAMVFTAGERGVSDHGAATYTLPLQVPPGAAGMEPKLSLQYNSQSGNGLFGVGLSLSGLSGIARCPRTLAQDGAKGAINYDDNDRLCLDGQRLMLIAGSYGADNAQYRLEHDNFSRIIGQGAMSAATSWFEVTSRNGTVMQYGNSSDSRNEAQGTSTIASWALYRSIDTSQNYLEWRYTKNSANGEQYPDKILYTGKLANAAGPAMPTFAEVRFLTEARPDQIPLYRAGAKTLLTQRIRKIQTVVDGALVREYRLDYDTSPNSRRSRVTQIQECYPNSTTNCLQPTTFTWAASGATPNYQYSSFASTPNWGALSTAASNPYLSLNMNGDGHSVLLNARDSAQNLYFFKQSGTGFSPVTTIDTFASDWDTPYRFFQMDVNGDGLTDILIRGGGSDLLCLSSVGAFTCTNSGLPFPDTTRDNDEQEVSNLAPNRFFVMDVNADGRADIVRRDDKGRFETYLSNGAGFTLTEQWPYGGTAYDELGGAYVVLDINGDGYPDLLQALSDVSYVMYGTGSGLAQSQTIGFTANTAEGDRVLRADINGDGLDDLVLLHDVTATTYLSTGRGFVYSGSAYAIPNPTVYSGTQLEIADLNGDGRDDLIARDPYGSVTAWLSNGTSFVASGTTTLGVNQNAPRQITVTDIDGDGRADLFGIDGSAYGVGTAWRLSDTWPDVVRTINNGIGELSVFDYDYLSYAPDLYVKDPIPAYPLVSLQYPLLVARAMTQTNLPPSACWSIGPLSQCPGASGITDPNPTTLTTRYRYGGLKAEQASGRGQLGFRWIEGTQVESGLVTTTEYEQSFPLTGLTQTVTTKVPSGGNAGVIKQVINTNNYVALPNGRYFTYLGQSSESKWDLNGAPYPPKTLTNTYACTVSQCYGNLTQSTVSATDGYSETKAFQYVDDTTHWLLGLPTHIDVTKTAP